MKLFLAVQNLGSGMKVSGNATQEQIHQAIGEGIAILLSSKGLGSNAWLDVTFEKDDESRVTYRITAHSVGDKPTLVVSEGE